MKDKIIDFLIIWLGLVLAIFILALILVGLFLLGYGINSTNIMCAIVGFLMLTSGIALVYSVYVL